MYTVSKNLKDGLLEIKADLLDVIKLVATNAERLEIEESQVVQCYIQNGELIIHLEEKENLK